MLRRRVACCARAARRSSRRKPWEKGDLARPAMQFDPDPLAGEGDAAHLHEQGRCDRRLRRRRRRLWLQLEAPRRTAPRVSSRDARAARAARRRARAPGHPARRARSRSPRRTTASFALRYLDYRDWQPGANRMTVRSPVAVRAACRCPTRWRSKASLVYDACRARRRSTTTRCPARRARRHRLPDGGRRQGHEVLRRLGGRRRRRVFVASRITCRAPARSMAHLERRSQSHVRVRLRRRATTRINRSTASRAGRPRDTLDYLRRRHAGAERRRPSSQSNVT